MAIARPTTKTIIATQSWGVPITDAVNANTLALATSRMVAFKGAVVNQANIAGGTPYPSITGQSISFTAKSTNNYLIVFGATLVPKIAQQWITAQVTGGGIGANVIYWSTSGAGLLWGINNAGIYMVGPGCQYSLSGSVALQQTAGTNSGNSIDVNGSCFIGAIDLGGS